MQQVVDLQENKDFRATRVQLLSISPDPPDAWAFEGETLGITLPLLSDAGNQVATAYGVMRWGMPTNEPGHTFVLVSEDGEIDVIRDYGAPENGGLMYVPPPEIVEWIRPRVG